MLLEYINTAMHEAKYEILEDTKEYYGEIPICPGVYAVADKLEDCRTELYEVLEEWILFRIYKNMSLPVINNITLSIKDVA